MVDPGSDPIEAAAERARAVLRACATPVGLRASAGPGGYAEVWARDVGVAALGICADGLRDVVPAVEASLEALTAVQSERGAIPVHVRPDGSPATENAGGIDGNLWSILTHAALARHFERHDLVRRHRDAIVRAMRWVHYQDSDEDGLLEGQEAADWADLLSNRGKVLYTNVLYVGALRAYADLAEIADLPDGSAALERAAIVADRLNRVHWVGPPGPSVVGEPERPIPQPTTADGERSGVARPLGDELERLRRLLVAELWWRPYYLPWVAFRDFGDWCDVLGNSLAILFGVADEERAALILDHFRAVEVESPVPARAIHPPLQPGEKDWRPYFRQGNLNLPDQYQNGGAWPFIGGFVVAALVAAGRLDEARRVLQELAVTALAEPADRSFNEWYHGRTGRPMGKPQQAWSAAMFLYARRAVLDGRPPWPSPGAKRSG
jgi:glycogen debranching enzyme